MTLIDRLRDDRYYGQLGMRMEAADEIERLRAALQIVARGDDGMDSYTALGMQNIAREALKCEKCS